MTRRILLVLALWLAALGSVSSGRAEEKADAKADALRLYGVERLEKGDVRELRKALGEGKTDAVAAKAQELSRLPGGDAATLAELAVGKSAVRLPEPYVAWLNALLPGVKPSAGAPSGATKRKQAANAAEVERLAACSSLRARLVDDLDATEPMPRDWSGLAADCAKPPDGAPILAVITNPGVDRLIAVSEDGVVALDRAHAIDLGRGLAFLLPVPNSAPITLRAFVGAHSVTHAMLLWDRRAVRLLFEEGEAVCLNVDFTADEDVQLSAFLDGIRLQRGENVLYPPSGALAALPGRFKLIGSRRGVDRTLESRALSWSSLIEESKRSGCQQLQLDVTQAPNKNVVALVSAAVSPMCVSNGIDVTELQNRAEQTLQRIAWRSRRARQWATLVSDFTSLMNQLDRQREVGAPRGLLDSTLRVEQGASEARRQGFDELLSVEVSCAPGTPTAQITVRATVLNLADLDVGEEKLRGLDLSEAQQSRIEIVPGAEYLDDGLLATLSQLHGGAYVRVQPPAGAAPFLSGARFNVLAYVPDAKAKKASPARKGSARRRLMPRRAGNRNESFETRKVKLAIRRLDDTERYLCQAANTRPSLIQQWWSAVDDHVMREVYVSPREQVSSPLEVQTRSPGVHLVRVELLEDKQGNRYSWPSVAGTVAPTVSYQCIETVEARMSWSLDLGYADGTALTPASDARRDRMAYAHLLVTGNVQDTDRSALIGGLALGYASAVHSFDAPPTWQLENSATLDYEPSGKLMTSWTRQSILLGPVISYRLRALPCRVRALDRCYQPLRHLGLLFRFVPVFDVGKIFAESVDPNLKQFAQGKNALDLDATAFFQGGLEIGITDRTSIYGLFDLGFVGWDDFLLGGRDQRYTRRTITYDAHTVIGGSIGVITSP